MNKNSFFRIGILLFCMLMLSCILSCACNDNKPHEHHWEVSILSHPTATTEGEQTEICIACGETQNRTVLPAIVDPVGNFSTRHVTVDTPMTYNVVGVSSSSLIFEWKVNGKTVTSKTYTPTSDCLEQYLSVSVYDTQNNLLLTDEIFCSRLPVFYISTEDYKPITSKTEYLPGTVIMQGSSAYPDGETTYYSGDIEIRGRGNSTWTHPTFKKKAYKIKLDKSTDLFGYGKSKHWILLANYIDESLCRNQVAHAAGAALGLTTMESTWVELILNGEHMGVYQLCEQIKVDEERIDIQSWENIAEDLAKTVYRTHEAEGFTKKQQNRLEDMLVENLSWISDGTFTFDTKTYTVSDYVTLPPLTGGLWIEISRELDEISTFQTIHDVPLMFKDPEYLTTNSELYHFATQYLQVFENALYSSDYTTLYKGKVVSAWDLADLDSAVKFWMVCDFFRNEIAGKSTHMYMDIDGKLTFGPVWDFDFSSGGNSPWGTQKTQGWHCQTTNHKWFNQMMKNDAFIQKAYQVYPAFRAFLEDCLKEGGLLDQYYGYLLEAGNQNSDLWFYKRGFETDLYALKSWITERMAFYDAQFKNLETLRTSMKGTPVQNTTSTTSEDNPAKVGVLISDYTTGNILLTRDTNLSYLQQSTTMTFPQGNELISCDVNIYSTATSEVVLYINGIKVNSQSIPTGNHARYCNFSIQANQLRQGQNVIRVIANRNNGYDPYQNTVYITKQ